MLFGVRIYVNFLRLDVVDDWFGRISLMERKEWKKRNVTSQTVVLTQCSSDIFILNSFFSSSFFYFSSHSAFHHTLRYIVYCLLYDDTFIFIFFLNSRCVCVLLLKYNLKLCEENRVQFTQYKFFIACFSLLFIFSVLKTFFLNLIQYISDHKPSYSIFYTTLNNQSGDINPTIHKNHRQDLH